MPRISRRFFPLLLLPVLALASPARAQEEESPPPPAQGPVSEASANMIGILSGAVRNPEQRGRVERFEKEVTPSPEEDREAGTARLWRQNADEVGPLIEGLEAAPDADQGALDEARALGADILNRAAEDDSPETYRHARDLVDPVLQRRPDHRDALNARAAAHYGLGRDEDAVRDASRVLEREEDGRAYTTRALAHYRLRNFPQAMEDARRALTLDPNNQTAFHIVKLAQGRITRPEDLDLSPRDRADAERIAKEYDARLREVGRIEAEARPDDDSPAARAQRRLVDGDVQGAARAAEEAVRRRPDDSRSFRARAAAKSAQGRYLKAVADATAGLRLSPGDARLLDARAAALLQLGRHREALEDSDRSIGLDPGGPHAYIHRALAKEGLGDLAGMIADYRKAAALSPRFAGELEEAVRKYPIALGPAAGRAPRGEEAAGRPGGDAGRARLRALLVPGCMLTGGALIAWGLRRALADGRRRRRAGPSLQAGYRLLRVVGQGGMGVVYEAQDKALGRRVAVKKMREEIRSNARERERFLQEARIVASLHHPNIVAIHAILEEAGDYYMVFEYVEGRSLDQILSEKNRLSLREAGYIIQAVCAALSYAHGKGVVHRDLKPSNIMVARDGRVKVMDFGIARQAKDALAASTLTGTVAGTPLYMAPELEQGVVRKEGDLYALGACLYEMLTGERPFAAPATTESKLAKRFAKPSRLAADIPQEIDALIDAALEPDPDRRVATALEFASRMAAACPSAAKA